MPPGRLMAPLDPLYVGRAALRGFPSPMARRGGRVVECAALEMRFTGNRNVGSNPTLSATNKPLI